MRTGSNGKATPITGLDRPLEIQDLKGLRISIKSAIEGGKVVSSMHWPPLPSKTYPRY